VPNTLTIATKKALRTKSPTGSKGLAATAVARDAVGARCAGTPGAAPGGSAAETGRSTTKEKASPMGWLSGPTVRHSTR
jgi:hypothetical protein